MASKILSEAGRDFYGLAYVKREYAIRKGIAGYSEDPVAAWPNPAVSNDPVAMKGLKASGTSKTDVIIRNADAATIHPAAGDLNLLSNCRVMSTVD